MFIQCYIKILCALYSNQKWFIHYLLWVIFRAKTPNITKLQPLNSEICRFVLSYEGGLDCLLDETSNLKWAFWRPGGVYGADHVFATSLVWVQPGTFQVHVIPNLSSLVFNHLFTLLYVTCDRWLMFNFFLSALSVEKTICRQMINEKNRSLQPWINVDLVGNTE